MVFINGPDRYVPIVPADPNVLAGHGGILDSVLIDGLHYRSGPNFNIDSLTSELVEDTATATLQTYQYWAEVAWKTRHGSYSSVERLVDKLDEEVVEARVAYRALKYGSEAARERAQAELLLELGDVAWCVMAVASNASAGLDSGFKNELYGYVMGIKQYDRELPVEPSWRERAAHLATKFQLVTLHDIDVIIQAGFEPVQSTVMNIDDDEPEMGPGDHIDLLGFVALTMGRLAMQQYNHGETRNTDGSMTIVMPELYDSMSSHIANAAANALMQIAYVAKHAVGASLADVVAANVRKITARIATNTIDKTDGPRNS